METGPHFRYLTLATLVGIFALIVLGGVVRITESGLGCPDWPLCHGRIIPPADVATLIEYSHRLVASVVGLLVLATLVVAWRRYRSRQWIFRPALFGLVMVIGQSALGGAAVLTELESYIVMIHHGNGPSPPRLFRPCVPRCLARSFSARREDRRTSLAFGCCGCKRAPADSNRVLRGVERRGGSLQPVAPVPRREVLRCLRTAPHTRGPPVGVRGGSGPSRGGSMDGVALPIAARLRFMTLLALVIFGAQVLVGALTVWWGLPTALRALHVALATLTWAALVTATLLPFTWGGGVV